MLDTRSLTDPKVFPENPLVPSSSTSTCFSVAKVRMSSDTLVDESCAVWSSQSSPGVRGVQTFHYSYRGVSAQDARDGDVMVFGLEGFGVLEFWV